MKCKNCGTDLDDNVKFCTKCGAEINETNPSAAQMNVKQSPVKKFILRLFRRFDNTEFGAQVGIVIAMILVPFVWGIIIASVSGADNTAYNNLTSENSRLTESNNKLTADVETLNKKINELTESEQKSNEEIKQLTEKNTNLENEYNAYKEKMQPYETEQQADANNNQATENKVNGQDVQSGTNTSGSPSTSSSTASTDTSSVSPESNGETVYIGDSGSKYHKQSCRTLKGKGHPISLDEAKKSGYTACKVCGG